MPTTKTTPKYLQTAREITACTIQNYRDGLYERQANFARADHEAGGWDVQDAAEMLEILNDPKSIAEATRDELDSSRDHYGCPASSYHRITDALLLDLATDLIRAGNTAIENEVSHDDPRPLLFIGPIEMPNLAADPSAMKTPIIEAVAKAAGLEVVVIVGETHCGLCGEDLTAPNPYGEHGCGFSRPADARTTLQNEIDARTARLEALAEAHDKEGALWTSRADAEPAPWKRNAMLKGAACESGQAEAYRHAARIIRTGF